VLPGGQHRPVTARLRSHRMESPTGGAEHGQGDVAPPPRAEGRAAGRWPHPSAGSRAGLPGGGEHGTAGVAAAPAVPPLERAPRPLSIWDVMQRQVDRAFADFIGGDYPPAWGEAPPADDG
jgi:hypothetical protein